MYKCILSFGGVKIVFEQVPTGITGLDDLIGGGFPENTVKWFYKSIALRASRTSKVKGRRS